MPLGCGNLFEDFVDDSPRFDTRELGFWLDDEPVGNDVRREILNGFGDDEISSFEKGQCLGRAHQSQRGARAGRELEVIAAAGGGDDFDDVASEFFSDVDFFNGLQEADDFGPVDDGWK